MSDPPFAGSGAIPIVIIRDSSEAVSENVLVPLLPLSDCFMYPAPPETESAPPLPPPAGAIAIVTVRYCSEAVSENLEVPLAPVDDWVAYPAPPEHVLLPEPLSSIVIAIWPLRPGLPTVTSSSSKPPIRKIVQLAMVVVTAGQVGVVELPPLAADL